LQPTAKSARRADESPFGALSGLTLTKMRSILRQPKANFATAKFGLKMSAPCFWIKDTKKAAPVKDAADINCVVLFY
jgi:hypothetical protein